jgi:hypothetical protein
MDAVAIRYAKKGRQLVHRCRVCGSERVNRVAEDTDQSDEIEALIKLPIR